MKQNFALVVIMALLLGSCYRDNKENLYRNFTNGGCDTANVTYSGQVAHISLNKCATSGCHVGSNPQSGLNLSTYDDLMTIAKDGRLMNRITGQGALMPPGSPLPACEIQQIQLWVTDGAPNN